VLNSDGTLDHEVFAPAFGDFEDRYIDIYRFTSIGAIGCSRVVTMGNLVSAAGNENLCPLEQRIAQ